MFKKGRARPAGRARARADGDGDDDATPAGSPLAHPATPGDSGAASGAEADDAEAGSVMERKKAQRKSKLAGAGKGSRLSFGVEEDKKSLLSQSLRAGGAASPAATPPAAAASTQSYSRQYLSELKAATPTAPAKPARGDESLSAARDKYASVLAEDTTAGIPDSAAIAAAKARRRAALDARKRGMDVDDGEEDYISLSGGRGDGPHPESRLMREEDEGDEGDEDLADYTEANERLPLGRTANKAAARRLKNDIGELIADREADESDEETRAWEEAILARAGGGAQPTERREARVQRKGYVPAPIPVARPVPTVGSAEARIAQRMAQLKVSRMESQRTLQTATQDLILLEEQERDVRKQVGQVEGKREWVDEFRGWVELLGSFLDEKFPMLEGIEKDATKYMKERAAMVAQRGVDDDSDDLVLFLRPLGDAPASAPAPELPADAEVRRVRRTARMDRRARRRGNVSAPADEDGFSTDSDLEDAIVDDYTAAQHDLERRTHALLEDVRAEDFRDPQKGLAVRFADWRARYPDEYNGAFGGLALVQAWEFWARGEMVGWDPLRVSAAGTGARPGAGAAPRKPALMTQSDTRIESFAWFTALYNYSRPRVAGAGDDGDDDDDMDLEPEVGTEGDLAMDMVTRVVVPLALSAIRSGAYNLYSTAQTRRAVDLAEAISDLTDRSEKSQTLLHAILDTFQEHIRALHDEITAVLPPPGPPLRADGASLAARDRYTRRRLKLVRNLVLWRRLAPRRVSEILVDMAHKVFVPVLRRTWEVGGRELAHKVVAAMGSAVDFEHPALRSLRGV